MAKNFHSQSKIRLYSSRIASCSAIALVLAASPVVFDLQTGELSYQSAMAKSCFTADTKVRMADGSLKSINAVKIGDRVLGLDGSINTVLGVERVPLGRRRLYGFNGGQAFVTAEHPFYTLEGWKSLDPERTAFENAALSVQRLTIGNGLLIWSAKNQLEQAAVIDNLALQLAIAFDLDIFTLVSIESIAAKSDTLVFNLLLDGNHTYFANDYLVHNKGGDSGSSGSGSGSSGSGSSGSGSGSSGSGSSGSGESGNDNSGESGDDNGGESGESGNDNSGESGDDNGGESGESGDDNGGESGESGDDNGGESGESGDDNGGERGESGESGDDNGGESGESGDDNGGESGERGESGDDESGESGERGELPRGRDLDGSMTTSRQASAFGRADNIAPAGRDLSREEEANLIERGWK